MKKIEIIVSKITNGKREIMYQFITEHKYLKCLLLNLFNYNTYQILAIKELLKRHGFYKLNYERFIDNKTKVEKHLKISIIKSKH